MRVELTVPSTRKTYTITTEHSASSYGIPVIVDDKGQVVEFSERLADGYIAAAQALGAHDDVPGIDVKPQAATMDRLARDMQTIHMGLLVAAGAHLPVNPDPLPEQMVECAWYGRSVVGAQA